MRICAYLHISRCLEPCGGVGRHANSLVRRLAQRNDMQVSTLFSRGSLDHDGHLPKSFPLRDLPATYLPGSELALERLMRLTGFPKLDRFGPEADWYYSPMESIIPADRARTAMTLHDVAVFETDLPWSNSLANRRARATGSLWVPRALQRVDRVFTVSEFSKRRMIEVFGTDPEKIHVIGNGVEDLFFKAGDDAIGKVEKTNEVVVLGGLRYKKGGDYILETADALRRRGSPIQIVVIGQTEADYREKAQRCSNITILGMVPDKELVGRLVRARALLLLSLYEGFGIPPLEAMACGTVPVVSNNSALPEVVGGGGLLFAPDQSDEIAMALDELRTDDALYAGLVRLGREHAQKYDWDRCAERLVKAFE